MDNSTGELISILNEILDGGQNRQSLVRIFQEKVWDIKESSPTLEILKELAYDLDYYEPDSNLQKEDSSYYGDVKMLNEIKSAIYKIRVRGQA